MRCRENKLSSRDPGLTSPDGLPARDTSGTLGMGVAAKPQTEGWSKIPDLPFNLQPSRSRRVRRGETTPLVVDMNDVHEMPAALSRGLKPSAPLR